MDRRQFLGGAIAGSAAAAASQIRVICIAGTVPRDAVVKRKMPATRKNTLILLIAGSLMNEWRDRISD